VRFTVYTLFPGLIESYLEEALLARARRDGIVEVVTRDMRRFAGNRTGRVDDAPYGGGAGMVMRVDVAAAALAEARLDTPPPSTTVLLSPAGERLTQATVSELATLEHVVLVSGRYEGFDARVEGLVDREISLGDFVLMGGELPALVLIEAVTRLLPGALGDEDSHRQESFATGLLDYPEYTRPPVFDGVPVPDTLLSGHHAKVASWRRLSALRRTYERRPDLLPAAGLSDEELALVASWEREDAQPTVPDDDTDRVATATRHDDAGPD